MRCDRTAGLGDVDRLEAEEASDRSAEDEPRLLQPGRRERQPHGVEMRVRDHGEAQQVGHALPVRLAVGGEREHRLEQRLELQRRADLADEPDRLIARVPETVRGAGLERYELARAEGLLLPAGLQPELPGLDREALALGRVHVRGCDAAVGLDDGLDHDRLAVGVGRGGEERDALAGDRVVDGVACADHLWPPSGAVADTHMLGSGGPKIVGRKRDSGSSLRLILCEARLARAEDYSSPGWMRPDSYASPTASPRSRRSRFIKPCATRALTVVSLTKSAPAISAFERLR